VGGERGGGQGASYAGRKPFARSSTHSRTHARAQLYSYADEGRHRRKITLFSLSLFRSLPHMRFSTAPTPALPISSLSLSRSAPTLTL